MVSFDVFDTLVTRLVPRPADVFEIAALKSGLSVQESSKFAETRVAAERHARASVSGEVTLADIYSSFPRGYLSADLLAKICETEISVEKSVCMPTDRGRRMFKLAARLGKRIVITSDMYLPRNVIEEILVNCGYEGWTDIFVSCEYGVSKQDGGIYRQLIGTDVSKQSLVLHVGDNLKSDVLNAFRNGVAAVWLPCKRRVGEGTVADRLLDEVYSYYAKSHSLSYEQFGYLALGSLLLGISQWLDSLISYCKPDRVFFLSRDGAVLLDALSLQGKSTDRCSYLYVSRKSLICARLMTCNNPVDFLDTLFLPNEISLLALFKKFLLDEETIKRAGVQLGVDVQVVKRTELLPEDVDYLRLAGYLFASIQDRAYEQSALLRDYLVQNNFEGRVAVVDIGWFGNMQESLKQLCDLYSIGAEIDGWYIGLNPSGSLQNVRNMTGYLFDMGHGYEMFQCEKNFNSLFEIMFSASHGTTLGYRLESNLVVPILAEPSESEAVTNADADAVRAGALRFVKEWADIFDKTSTSLDAKRSFEAISRLGRIPTRNDLRLFSNWSLEADSQTLPINQVYSLVRYRFNLRRLLCDWKASRWKVGAFRSLFGIPIPFYILWNRRYSISSLVTKIINQH